jgi:Kef-type K+ transport system membrane component KefB
LSDTSSGVFLAAALAIAVCSVPRSPSTAIAIIDELGAKGVVSQGVLAMKVMLDVFAVFLFAISLSVLKTMLAPAAAISFDTHILLELLWEICGAIVVGIVLAVLVSIYLRYYNRNLILFILAVCVLSIQLCKFLHVEAVITPLVMGFCVRNFSNEGKRLINAISNSKIPIYVIFFGITGASLALNFLLENWWIAILLVMLIRFLNWFSFYLGLRVAKMPEKLTKFAHYGFISQAGVTLGFAAIVERVFSQAGHVEMGHDLRAIIVAIVVVHQLIGPPLFHYSLVAAGESREQRQQARMGELAPAKT